MKYINSYQELIEFILNFHLLSEKPSLVIFDDLSSFFSYDFRTELQNVRFNFVLQNLAKLSDSLKTPNSFIGFNVIASFCIEMDDIELYKKYINFAFYYCDLVLYGKVIKNNNEQKKIELSQIKYENDYKYYTYSNEVLESIIFNIEKALQTT